MNEENVVRINSTRKEKTENDNLIILYDLGYDTGRYDHVKIQMGLVDVRCVKSAISEDEGGYQRLLATKRVEYITNDFHMSRFNPIIISVRKNGEIYNIDGQARVSSVRYLYKNGTIESPMVPCIILTNATIKDECMLFGTQDDGNTRLRETQKLKSKYKGMDDKTLELSNALEECGIGLFKDIQAHKTIQDLYWNIDKDIFKRICKVISGSWLNGTKAQRKNATCKEILNGLTVFYTKYSDEINDKIFISKLALSTPDSVRDLFENYKNKLDPDRKYLKTFAEIYNKNRRSNNRIDYV